MRELSNQEMFNINGGNGVAIGFFIAAGITFLIGVIDGYVRPLKCN